MTSRPGINVVLISTSDVSSGRSEALDRMLHSVALAAARLPDIPISHLLLLQRCPDRAFRAVERSLPSFVKATPIGGQVSLSAARNLLLSGAQAAGLFGRRTVIGFPDDDCWYPEGALEYIVRLFAQAPELNLWFCRYSSSPRSTADAAQAPATPTARAVIRYASSNTTFVRGCVLEQSPVFDETLGIGTANIGGEDTEFALRAYVFGGRSLYLPVALIGHRENNPRLRARYYRGGLIAIARHAPRRFAIIFEFFRKIAVGIWLVGNGELALSTFTGAVRGALRSRKAATHAGSGVSRFG